MCESVFLAADIELPLVEWDENHPAFNVVPLSKHEEVVRKQFTKPYIYYLGSHTGCSCGFWPDSDGSPGEMQKSINALVRYVTEAAGKSSVEIFVCWEGECEKKPKQKTNITVDGIRQHNSWLKELQLTRIQKAT